MQNESTPGARGPVFCGVDTHADSHWLCVLDWADGTLTGRDRMRLFGSAVSLHAPIRSCGGLGSPRPARDMSGNEGSPMGASGMWGHRAVRI